MYRPRCCLALASLSLAAALLAAPPPGPAAGGGAKAGAKKETPHPVYKSRYRVIDIHAHAPFPSEAAVRAHLDMLDRVGVHAFNVLLLDAAGYSIRGGWSEANLLAWLQLRRRFPDRLLVFGTVDFSRAAREPAFFHDVVVEMERAAARGMQGVKVWKNLGMYYRGADKGLLRIDDPRLDPLWKTCGKLGLPVLIHTADPKEYWEPSTYNTFLYHGPSTGRYYKHPAVPPWEELIRQRNVVLKKHPKTIFIGAHFASHASDLDELARTFDAHPNLYADCSAVLKFFYRYHRQAVRDFFVKYQDRILFGTDDFLVGDHRLLGDAEGMRQWQQKHAVFYSRYLEYFETDHLGLIEPYGTNAEWMRLAGVNLPPPVLEKLYHANAERLLPGQAKAPAAAGPGG